MEKSNEENNQQENINIPETPIPEYDPIRFINYRLRTNPYVTSTTMAGNNTSSNSTRNTVRPPMFVSQMLYPNVAQSYVPMGSYRYPPNNRPKVPPGFMPHSGVPNSFMPYRVQSQYMPQIPIPISNCSYYDPRTVAIATTHTKTNSGPAICSMIATYTHINSQPVMTSMTLGCTQAFTSLRNGPGLFSKTVSYVNDTFVTVESVSYNNVPFTCKVTYSHINDPVVSSNTDPAAHNTNTGHKHDMPTSVGSTDDTPLEPVIFFSAATFTPLSGLGVTNTWRAQENYAPVPKTTYPDFWSRNESVNRANTTAVTTSVTSSGPVCSSQLWENYLPNQNAARRRQIFQGPISNSDTYRSSLNVFPPQRPRENRAEHIEESDATLADDFEEIADIIRIVTPETVYESADSFKDGEGPRIENFIFYDKEFNVWKTYKPTWETICQNSETPHSEEANSFVQPQRHYPELYSQSFFLPSDSNHSKKVDESSKNTSTTTAVTTQSSEESQFSTSQENYPEPYSQTFFYPSEQKTLNENSKNNETCQQNDLSLYSESFFSAPDINQLSMDENCPLRSATVTSENFVPRPYTCQQNGPGQRFISSEQNQWKSVDDNSKTLPPQSSTVTTKNFVQPQYDSCEQNYRGLYSQSFISRESNQWKPIDDNSKNSASKSNAVTTESFEGLRQQNDPGIYSENFFVASEEDEWVDYTVLGDDQNLCETTNADNSYVSDTSTMVCENDVQNGETQETNLQPINCVEQDMENTPEEEVPTVKNYLNGYPETYVQDINGMHYQLDSTGYMTPEPYISFIFYNPFTPEQIAEINRGSKPATKPNSADNGATGIQTKGGKNKPLQEKNTTVSGAKSVETTAPKPLKIKEYRPPVPKKVVPKKPSSIVTTNTKNLKLLYKEPVEQTKKLPQPNKSDKGKKAQVPEKDGKNTGKPFAKNNKVGKNKPKEEEEKPKQKGKQQKSSKKK